MTISIVVFDVQVSFDPYSLTSIDVLMFVGIVFPQRSIQIHITVCPGGCVTDYLEWRLHGKC